MNEEIEIHIPEDFEIHRNGEEVALSQLTNDEIIAAMSLFGSLLFMLRDKARLH